MGSHQEDAAAGLKKLREHSMQRGINPSQSEDESGVHQGAFSKGGLAIITQIIIIIITIIIIIK